MAIRERTVRRIFLRNTDTRTTNNKLNIESERKKCGSVGPNRKDVDIDGNITLIWILDKYKVKYGLKKRSIAGFCDDADGL
jgi:hypothetical protein